MKPSRWPDFLFTVAGRLMCGFLLGGLACFLIFWEGLLRASAHSHHSWALIWVMICGVVGAIIAAFTIPRWQTPWYQRREFDLNTLSELDPDGEDWMKQGGVHVEKSVSIKVTGEDGVEHTYASLEEVPPELRPEIEASIREAEKEKGVETSAVTTSETGDGFAISVNHQKQVSRYKIIDETGAERIYHSLDEMPPELREAVIKAGESDQTRNKRQDDSR